VQQFDQKKNFEFFSEFHQNSEKSYEKLIDNFYAKKILKCKHLLKYFEGKNLKKSVKNIGNFLYSLLTENNENFMNKEQLKTIHKSMKISHDDYDLYKGLFAIMMREMKYSEELIGYFNLEIERVRQYIVHQKTFGELFTTSDKNMNFLIGELRQKIKTSLPLSWIFNDISSEQIELHQKRIVNLIFGTVPFIDGENNNYQSYHKKLEITAFEFFEMKNIFSNLFLDIYNSSIKNAKDFPITFPIEIERIFSNIECLRPLIISNPTKNLEKSINLKFISELITNKITQNKEMNPLFASWSFQKLVKHSEIILSFIFKFPSNKYFECDLIPAHCKANIKSTHFLKMCDFIKNVLLDLKINRNLLNRAMQDLYSTKHHIIKENTFFDQIGGAAFVSPCVDHIYINLFGDLLTKHFFINSDGDYIKHKQKIFMCKVFQNKIGSFDLDDLKSIHSKHNISKVHFDHFMKYAQEYISIAQLSLTDEMEIVKEIKRFEPYIVFQHLK